MAPALVSVLIRSMGRPMLQTALDSIARQDYPNIEVCVVAASGAAHSAIATSCGSFPLRLVGNGKRLQGADAANFGLDSARGDYCVFLDDDDFHDPDHVSGLMTLLVANPGMRVAYSRVRVIGGDGKEADEFGSFYDRLALHERNYIQVGAGLFERGLAEHCRFDPEVGPYNDWDFWLQCSEHTDFAFRDHASTNWNAETGESGAGSGTISIRRSMTLHARPFRTSGRRCGKPDRPLIALTEAAYAAQQRGDIAQAERPLWRRVADPSFRSPCAQSLRDAAFCPCVGGGSRDVPAPRVAGPSGAGRHCLQSRTCRNACGQQAHREAVAGSRAAPRAGKCKRGHSAVANLTSLHLMS
jgi:hypothetical protein